MLAAGRSYLCYTVCALSFWRFTISNTTQGLVEHAVVNRADALWRRLAKRVAKILGSRRVVRTLLVLCNVALLVAIAGFSLNGTQAEKVLNVSPGKNNAETEPLDQLSSADIARNAATAIGPIGMPEVVAVSNQADSVAAELAVSPADTTVVAKPQAVATTFASRKDIKTYVVQAGDTVASIAGKFNITSDSVMWSNNLNGNSINAGVKLVIPPVNGIVYSVKSGDTIDSLTSKYRADKDQFIAVNDIELTGLQAGEQILIPNGQQPAAATYAVRTVSVAVYGPYNGYDYGFCTWYVANRRAAAGSSLPSNLGNASTWDDNAAAMGILVDKTPTVGAAVVTSQRGAGHVAYVEAVNDDGSIWVSEMNSYGQVSMTDSTPRGGWGIVDWKLIPAASAATYNYVH